MNKRIFGFTLAEVMVTIMVIGVVAGITIPVLHKMKADKDTQVYRKALYTLQRGAYNFMNGTGYLKLQKEKGTAYDETIYLKNFKNWQVCEALAEEINTLGDIDCTDNSGCDKDGKNCKYDKPNFVTTDGIGFYNLGGGDNFSEKNIFIRLVDERKSETEARKKKPGASQTGFMRINMNHRGKFSVPTVEGGSNWAYEQSLIEDYTKLNE